jgi:cytochrome o ubiquinol oxidase subunit 2
MGGMTTHLDLMADQPGEFPGMSANFSGDGFSGMHFIARAVRSGDFASWLSQVREAGPPLDDATFARLEKPSEAVPPTTYGSVVPRLFDRIVKGTGAGPETATGTAWCRPTRQAGG